MSNRYEAQTDDWFKWVLDRGPFSERIMTLQEALRKELGGNPKAYVQETVERVNRIIEALSSDQLSRAEKSSVQQYKEKLKAHTQKTLYELIAIM